MHGTFFETLPTPILLSELWTQLLTQAHVPPELQQQVIAYLAQLERTDIAQTRQIALASVKPRLRIMSEIQADGNPHTYAEISPRSVNLIVKPPEEIDDGFSEWLREQFQQEGVAVSATPQSIQIGGNRIQVEVKRIHHRRNGLHWVVQAIA
ncbi:MAG: hypothetical protein NZM28_00470 [Fimbriimonadales bacterium]|nr:hypothetical protein [Fimbriimonadales bacterium]